MSGLSQNVTAAHCIEEKSASPEFERNNWGHPLDVPNYFCVVMDSADQVCLRCLRGRGLPLVLEEDYSLCCLPRANLRACRFLPSKVPGDFSSTPFHLRF